MPPPGREPRLLVLNQYYWPGVEATAQLLAQLCEALADEFEVRVVTGRLRSHLHRLVLSCVMPGLVPGIHVFTEFPQARRRWPGQARP